MPRSDVVLDPPPSVRATARPTVSVEARSRSWAAAPGSTPSRFSTTSRRRAGSAPVAVSQRSVRSTSCGSPAARVEPDGDLAGHLVGARAPDRHQRVEVRLDERFEQRRVVHPAEPADDRGLHRVRQVTGLDDLLPGRGLGLRASGRGRARAAACTRPEEVSSRVELGGDLVRRRPHRRPRGLQQCPAHLGVDVQAGDRRPGAVEQARGRRRAAPADDAWPANARASSSWRSLPGSAASSRSSSRSAARLRVAARCSGAT